MRLYNTLTKSVDELTPIDGKTVKIYTCGPTVYNHAHIGNLSTYIYADTLRRAVRYGIDSNELSVEHVINFTDVDDKTVRDSALKYPDLAPMEALMKFTRHWEEIFLNEMTMVGNDNSKFKFVRATENIDEMINIIKHLLDKNIAYIADDGVYFNIAEYKKTRTYGQLSHIDTPTESRARINNDEYDKESAQDFALWKVEKPGEPSWDFKIGNKNLRGRPGWHIECSAMSVKNLGQPFDIHTGGVDHIFPHHENEIAQSTAGDQPEKYANFFVHNEFLLVDGKKMAKSENNFYTLQDVIKKGFDPLDFRMLVLQGHYRSATNFSWENLEAARNRRKNWRNFVELRHQISQKTSSYSFERILDLIEPIRNTLQNDLNTPGALVKIDAILDEISHDIFVNFEAKDLDIIIDFIDKYLGLKLYKTTPDISDEQKNLIRKREVARVEKDFTKSDRIRDELLAQGIELKDLPNNKTIWSRT